jgi:hypothetical protein
MSIVFMRVFCYAPRSCRQFGVHVCGVFVCRVCVDAVCAGVALMWG